MGVREEIEKLRVDSSMLTPPYPRSHFDHLQTHNKVFDAILSILDEHLGGCVLEDTVCHHNYLNNAVRELMKAEGNDWFAQVGKGDRVSIYVKRKRCQKGKC